MAPKHRHPIVASMAISRDFRRDMTQLPPAIDVLGLLSVVPIANDGTIGPETREIVFKTPIVLVVTFALLYPETGKRYRIDLRHRIEATQRVSQLSTARDIDVDEGGWTSDIVQVPQEFDRVGVGLNTVELWSVNQMIGSASFYVDVSQQSPPLVA